jgi:hypothetical protein
MVRLWEAERRAAELGFHAAAADEGRWVTYLLNQLRMHSIDRAELVSTYNRREGYSEGASPHTWSIVDNAELVEWFLDQAKR